MQLVTLRKLEEDDLDSVYRWRNDPDVTRHLARLEVSREELRAWFIKIGQSEDESHAILADGEFVGYAILDHIDRANRKCEVGIVIGSRERWGKGIGRTVARLLADRALEELSMHRVLAVASGKNPASIACFLAAGFKEEGRLREANLRDSEFVDLVLLSLLEHEWSAARITSR